MNLLTNPVDIWTTLRPSMSILTSGSIRKIIKNSVPYNTTPIPYQIPYGGKRACYICRLDPIGYINNKDLIDPLDLDAIQKINLGTNNYIEPHSAIMCSTMESFIPLLLCLPIIELLPVYTNCGLFITKSSICDFRDTVKIRFTLINGTNKPVRLYPTQGIVTLVFLKSHVDITLEKFI